MPFISWFLRQSWTPFLTSHYSHRCPESLLPGFYACSYLPFAWLFSLLTRRNKWEALKRKTRKLMSVSVLPWGILIPPLLAVSAALILMTAKCLTFHILPRLFRLQSFALPWFLLIGGLLSYKLFCYNGINILRPLNNSTK